MKLLIYYLFSSTKCQQAHWNSGHKTECKVAQLPDSKNSAENALNSNPKTSGVGRKTFSGLALVPARGTSKLTKKPKEVAILVRFYKQYAISQSVIIFVFSDSFSV